MYRLRVGQRIALVSRLGGGGGAAVRESDGLGFFDDMPTSFPFVLDQRLSGVVFDPDSETFIVGTKRFNMADDVTDGMLYGDFLTRLRVRLTSALAADLYYRFRDTNDHFLGDWYAELGNRHVRSDLYNFRLREHNAEAIVRYALARPRLNLFVRVFRNLIADDDTYPQELRRAYGVGGEWRNAARTVAVATGVGVTERGIFHPSASALDPSHPKRAFTDSSLGWTTSVAYRPVQAKWWTRVSISFSEEIDESVAGSTASRFTENDDLVSIAAVIGGELGKKWVAELAGEWDSRVSNFRRLGVTLKRDLHDVILLFRVRLEQDVFDDGVETSNTDDDNSFVDQVDIQIAFRPKFAKGNDRQGIPGITVLDGPKPPADTADLGSTDTETSGRY